MRVFNFLKGAWLIPAVALFIGCDQEPEGVRPAFQIDCFQNDDAAMVFEAVGVVQDHGVVTGTLWSAEGWLEDGGQAVAFRTFDGAKGSIEVMIEAQAVNRGSQLATGDFYVVGGTGEYLGFDATGSYQMGPDEKGIPAEYFRGTLK